ETYGTVSLLCERETNHQRDDRESNDIGTSQPGELHQRTGAANLKRPCEHEQRNACRKRQTEYRGIGPPQDAAGPEHAAQEKQPGSAQPDGHKIGHFKCGRPLYRWRRTTASSASTPSAVVSSSR